MSQRYVFTTLLSIFLFDLRFCDLTIEAGRLQNEDNSKYSISFFILNLNEFIKTFVNCFFFFLKELKLIKSIRIGAIDIHILSAQETNLI